MTNPEIKKPEIPYYPTPWNMAGWLTLRVQETMKITNTNEREAGTVGIVHKLVSLAKQHNVPEDLLPKMLSIYKRVEENTAVGKAAEIWVELPGAARRRIPLSIEKELVQSAIEALQG